MRVAPKLFVILTCLHIQSVVAQRVALLLLEIGTSVPFTLRSSGRGGDNFRSIRIDSGQKRFGFVPKSPAARISKDRKERMQRGLWASVPCLRLEDSRYFFRGEYTTYSRHHTLLFFISEGYASDAAPLLVLGFKSDGTPYKVLERSEMGLYRFESTSDGNALLIGKATMSQVFYGDGTNNSTTPYALTDDPLAVFILHEDSLAHCSLTESRKYNRLHYVWAGPHSREDYAVIYNLPGHRKPFGAPAIRAQAILGGKVNPSVS